MTDSYVWFEPTAREIAVGNFRRFGAWLLGEELSEEQKLQRLEEVFAQVAHDGVMTGFGLAKLAMSDDFSLGSVAGPEDLLEAEHRGYLNGIEDVDKGQGEK